MDKLTAQMPDIYGNLTWILQKNPGFDGQFTLIDTFRAGFVRIFAAFPGVALWPEKSESNRCLLGCGDGYIDELNTKGGGPRRGIPDRSPLVVGPMKTEGSQN